jgi:hypothetical protein
MAPIAFSVEIYSHFRAILINLEVTLVKKLNFFNCA